MKLSKKEKRAKIQSIRLGMEKLEYECHNWSPKADRILRDMYLAGYDYSDIALRLNRTETAIHGRLHQLGLLNIGENNARKRQARQERVPSCLCAKCDLKDRCTKESGNCIYEMEEEQ